MKGKVAIVTASSTGIGKAIISRLGQEGCNVIVSSRNQKHIDSTVQELQKKGIKAYGIVCHVGKKQQRTSLINKTIEKYGRIDYVVANAAVSTQMGNFLEATSEMITKMWEINYFSVFLLIQEALPYLRKQKKSAVVLVSSYAAYDLPSVIGHYSITKTALLALCKLMAKQLQNDDIRVNCICPGLIKTQFSSIMWKQDEKQAAENMQVSRLGETDEIANAVKFLLSEDSSYMTGESIVVAGRPSSRL